MYMIMHDSAMSCFLYLFYILDLNEIIKYIVQNFSSSELQLFSSPAHDPAYSVTGYTFI